MARRLLAGVAIHTAVMRDEIPSPHDQSREAEATAYHTRLLMRIQQSSRSDFRHGVNGIVRPSSHAHLRPIATEERTFRNCREVPPLRP